MLAAIVWFLSWLKNNPKLEPQFSSIVRPVSINGSLYVASTKLSESTSVSIILKSATGRYRGQDHFFLVLLAVKVPSLLTVKYFPLYALRAVLPPPLSLNSNISRSLISLALAKIVPSSATDRYRPLKALKAAVLAPKSTHCNVSPLPISLLLATTVPPLITDMYRPFWASKAVVSWSDLPITCQISSAFIERFSGGPSGQTIFPLKATIFPYSLTAYSGTYAWFDSIVIP